MMRLIPALMAARAAFRLVMRADARAVVLHRSLAPGRCWDCYPSEHRDDGLAAAAVMQQRIGQRHRYHCIRRTADAEQQMYSLIGGAA